MSFSELDGHLPQSFPIGHVLTVKGVEYRTAIEGNKVVWVPEEKIDQSIVVSQPLTPTNEEETSQSDPKRRFFGIFTPKVKPENRETSNSMDSQLDQFDPSQYDFFVIGDPIACPPCKRVRAILEVYAEQQEMDEKSVTIKEWKFDLKNKRLVNDMQHKWLEREKTRDSKLAQHTTIPKIWHKGHFIGGESDLQTTLASIYSP